MECSSFCSVSATCLTFSFESGICEVGGDPGELSPSEPLDTPMPFTFTTKLITGTRKVHARKCKKGKTKFDFTFLPDTE